MACWDEVEKDFGDDETGNFGPRVETGTGLYQVDTTACINPSGEVTENPKVSVAALQENICVAADRHISIFQDSGHKYLKTIAADNAIEKVTFSEDGNFIVYGESDGTLHFIFVENQMVFFSQKIPGLSDASNEKCFRAMFFTPIDGNNRCDLVVLDGQGRLHLINIGIVDVAEALQNEDCEALRKLKRDISLSVIDLTTVHDTVYDVAVFNIPGCRTILLSAGVGDNVLCVWGKFGDSYKPIRQASHNVLLEGDSVMKIRMTTCGRYFVALDNVGLLTMWSTCTLTVMKVWKQQVCDFYLVDADQADQQNDGELTMKMVLLTPADKEGSCELLVCKLSNMEVTYCLQLAGTTTLAQFPTFQENIFVIEGTQNAETPSEFVSTLRVRCLSEALPEARFNRILHKKKFDEAEAFAKMFKLDVELVYKVKSYHLLDFIAPWNPSKISKEEIEESMKQLCTCLELIEDDEHVIDCCIKATPPTFEGTFNLLKYARTRLHRSSTLANGGEDASGEALLANILETLHRLATFEVAFGAQTFSADAWEKFLRVNLLKEFLTQLGNGRLETSFSLWRRHQSEFERYFKLTTIDKILENLPVQTESKDIKPWLKEDFIPYIVRHHPSGLEKIARWLEQKAKAMEMTEKENWPANAIAMCELLQTTCATASQSASERGLATPQHFATQLCNLSVGYKQVVNKTGDEHNPFVRLHILLAQLRDLQNLHNKYKCHLSLDLYIKETTESLTYRMLDRVMALELIPSTIEKYVRPYMVEHGLNEEKMLFQYIGDLVERSYKMISYMGEAPWEAKAIAVISCIKDPDFKCQAVLRAMQQAYIPWTQDMENLVNAGLALDHPRVAEIKEQCRLYELRKMLIKYNLKNLDFYKSSTVTRLVVHIIRKDLPSAVEDALLITRTDKIGVSDEFVYMARINFLLNQAKVWEILELLKSLPEEKAFYCARTLVERAVDCGNFCEDMEVTEKVVITRLAVDVIKFMLSLDSVTSEKRQDYQCLLQKLRKLSALQVEFNEFLTFHSLQDEKFKENLLRQKVKAYFALKSSNGLSSHETVIQDFTGQNLSRFSNWSLTRVFRFGELLGIPKDTLRGMLAVAAAARGEVSMALKMAREQFEDNEMAESGAILYKVCHILCGLLSQDNLSKEMVDNFAAVNDLPAVIFKLTSKAITVCRPELLSDCIELCRGTRLAMNVAHLCESGDYGLTVKTISEQKLDMTNQDPYKEWTFEPTIYKEDGLVMDSTIAMPLVYKYCMAILPTAENYKKSNPYVFEGRKHLISLATGSNKKSGLETLNSSCQAIVSFLHENSQMELGLQYCVDDVVLLHCLQSIAPGNQRIKTVVQKGVMCIDNQLKILLMKVLNQGKVDQSLALGLCLSTPESVIWGRLKKTEARFGQHFKKIVGLSTVAMELAKILNDVVHLKGYDDTKKLAQCGYCMMKMKVAMKNTPGNITNSKQIISDIIRGKFVSVKLVRELCSTFRVEEEHVLFIYLKQLLAPIPATGGGEDSVQLQLAKTNKQLATAYNLTRIITNKDLMKETLLEIYGSLDPYDYERIDFVLSRLNEIYVDKETEYGLELMTYLKAYKRVSEPSDHEETYRQTTDDDQLMYDRSSLPPLAKERLPFHALLDKAWPIISNELNEDTVEILLPITSLLQLNQDHVYVTAIQNMVTRYVSMWKHQQKQHGRDGVDKSKCVWELQSKETEKLFKDIVMLLKGIKQLDTAMACMQWCIKVLPMGYDKVKALELSVHVAEAWMKSASGEEKIKATETHKKLTEFYRRSSTEQALFRRKLGESRLLELSNKAAKLTLKLYEHPSIQQRGMTGSNVQHLPDIHAAAEEIAKINNLNLEKIHQALIEKWLPSTLHRQPDEADITMNYEAHLNLDMTVATEEESSEDEINLARVVYILQYGPVEKHVPYLREVAFARESNSLTMMCRVRALRCLFSLLDIATIEEFLQTPMEKIREYVQTLLYLVEFERLHVPHTEATFRKCSKEGLVRGIFRNHSHKPRAVRLVADMCLDFNIHDTQLWNSALQQMMAFNMTEYLGHVLVCLSGIPMLWQVKCVQNMWCSVLLAPLKKAVAPLSESQLDDCWKAANLLHRCPLLLDMDLVLFARHFLRVEMPICALGCLLLVSEEESRNKHLQDLFGQIPCREMLEKLNQHIVDTRVVPMLSGIKDTLFSHINREKKFPDVMTSSFARDFGLFVVRQKKIEDLLLFILRNNKLAEALQLVKLYMAMNATSPTKTRSQDPYIDIRMYLREHGLKEEEKLLPKEIGVEEFDDYLCRSPVSSLMVSP